MTHFERVIQRVVDDIERYRSGEWRGEKGLVLVQKSIGQAIDALDVSEAPRDFLERMSFVTDRLELAWYASPRAQREVDAILDEVLAALRQELSG